MTTASLSSIAPLLPLHADKGWLRWTSSAEFALKAVARGPDTSLINNGLALYECMEDIRTENGDSKPLSPKIAVGLSRLCDEVEDIQVFFEKTVPTIAVLALELPSLLERHGREIGKLSIAVPAVTLRVLSPQQPGMVLLHQHLIAALLACAFFCLYPGKRELRTTGLVSINFDGIYLGVAHGIKSNVQKLLCLIHYFEKVGGNMPAGTVSFERKVLSSKDPSLARPLPGPTDSIWSASKHPLCQIKVIGNGAIEDAGSDYLQVDFANEQLGGGALHSGCVQEEIRFMTSPECIAGMLFLPTMTDNESIEIIGAEMYSEYTGYGASFCFAGDHTDNTPRDSWGRRKTCIGAIDALCLPGESQFEDELMIRELNKAYCGFLNHSSLCGFSGAPDLVDTEEIHAGENSPAIQDSQASGPSECEANYEVRLDTETLDNQSFWTKGDSLSHGRSHKAEPTGTCVMHQTLYGVATGNWGAGAFGGNLQLKSLLQWLAASQARQSMVLYYTFSDARSQRMQEVVDWIHKEEWCVSELWSILQQYGKCRISRQVRSDLYDWILPLGNAGRLSQIPQQSVRILDWSSTSANQVLSGLPFADAIFPQKLMLHPKTVRFKGSSVQKERENLMMQNTHSLRRQLTRERLSCLKRVFGCLSRFKRRQALCYFQSAWNSESV